MKLFLFYALIWHLTITLNGGATTDICRTQTFSKPHVEKTVTKKRAARLKEIDVLNPVFILK